MSPRSCTPALAQSRAHAFPVLAAFLLATVFARLLAPAALADQTEAAIPESRQVENLAALARVFGYVRFFHPGDRAAATDWDRVLVLGAEAVRGAPDTAALREALLGVFGPLAPQIRIESAPIATQPEATAAGGRNPAADPTAPAGPQATQTGANSGTRLTFWQYRGLNLSQKRSVYQQRRVILGQTGGDRAPLFPVVSAPAPLTRTVAPDLVLSMPLALPVDEDGKTPEADNPGLAALQRRLDASAIDTLDPLDWRLHVARIVKVWSAFQHFHPYLDGRTVRWDGALTYALRRALDAGTVHEQHDALSELVAATGDGHGFVYGAPAGRGSLPIRTAVVEGSVVVTGVAEGAPLRKGDIIESVDRTPALELLAWLERRSPGSSHLSRFRALNQFGLGASGSAARVEIVRDGKAESVDATRSRDGRQYFFNSVGEFEFPAFAEVRPGILYVNLHELGADELRAKLPQLAAARGVIFDWRLGARTGSKPPAKGISPHADIIPHLIDRAIQASPMRTPQIQLPDRAGWSYRESTWPVEPRAPRLRGKVVFINEPSVVSYGETCMAMIAHHRLATLVGDPTAGCNGNATFIPLPGGGEVMWTAMDVRRHDGTSFYGVGFVPDHPVARTLRGVREGRDEYLEKAVDVIEGGGS